MLKEVDKIEVLTLMDNYVNVLLRDTDIVRRAAHTGDGEVFRDTVVGEHGLSLWVTVQMGLTKHTVLFDTGYSAVGLSHNIQHLGLDLKEIESIVLSHGHMDHLGSLKVLLEMMPKPVPVLVHPYAFTSPRYVKREDGGKDRMPPMPGRGEIETWGGQVRETATPTLICEDMILVSGEVERSTSFEKGMSNAFTEVNGELMKDPISDDQSLIMHLRGKGLVVISGCAHSGIINTLLYSKRISGVERLHAVLGGFHLSGPQFEPVIEETIQSLREMNPKVFVPMHCTGWKAVHRCEEAFPEAFVLNSVGSKYTLA